MTKEQQIPAAVLRRDDEGGPLPQMVAQHREQLRQEREATPSSNPRRFVLTRDPIRPLGVAMEHAKTGPWVPWEDCEVLIRERDEARDEAERMRRTRDEEIRRLRSAHETAGCRIGVMLCVHCGKENRVAVEPTELPEALRDPVKNLERGRELLKAWGPTPVTDAALAESKESPLARAVRIARGDTGPPTEPVRFAEKASDDWRNNIRGPDNDEGHS